jgi:hypothetical protein
MQLRSDAWAHGHIVTQVESNVTGAAQMQLRSDAWAHGYRVTLIGQMKKAAILPNKHIKLSDFRVKITKKWLCQYILHD